MAISTLPPAPSRTDPSTFSDKADALLGALSTFVTEANATAAAMNLNDTTDISASSVAIGQGAKTFTVTASKSFQPGMWLVIADTAAPSTNQMFGSVTSYSGTTLVMDITNTIGSGTKTAWTISQSAPSGAMTAFYPDPSQSDQGAATVAGNLTVKDFVDSNGTSKIASIVLRRGSTGNNTDYTFLTSGSIPSNIALRLEPGARVNLTGVNLTVGNFPNEGNLTQTVTGDGLLVLSGGACNVAYSEWWGARADGNGAGGGTESSSAIAKALVCGVGHVALLAGVYRCDSAIVINTEACILSGNNWASILDFTNLGSGSGLTILQNGVAIEKFKIHGNLSIIGLDIHGSCGIIGATSIDIDNCNIGFHTDFTWENQFDKIFISQCNLGWECQSQTNAVVANSLSIVNCKCPITFQNAGGIYLSSPTFQNITDPATLYAITLRQSSIVLTNPYFENLNNAELALLGGNGDTISSSLIINGGMGPGTKDILYYPLGEYPPTISVRGLQGGCGIRTLETSGYSPLDDAVLSNTDDYNQTNFCGIPVKDSNGSPEIWFDCQHTLGNASNYYNSPDKFATFTRAGAITQGYLDLVPGAAYVLVYAVRRTNPSQGVTIRWYHGGFGGSVIQTAGLAAVPLNTEPFKLQFLPFRAVDDTLGIIFDYYATGIELKVLKLLKGHVFPRLDIHKDMEIYNSGYPVNGLWLRNSRIWDFNPESAAPMGWICRFRFDTTLSVGEPSGETSMAVVAGTGSLDGDIIGVLQDNGVIHWTTIASGGGSTTLVLTIALTADAAAGNAVYILRWKGMANLL